jgi:hypothetical protein
MNHPDPDMSDASAELGIVPSSAMAPSFAIELGIAGLPEFSSDMVSGGLYALNVRTSSARFPLLSSSLQSAIQSGLRCTIVTASAPEDLLQRLDTPGGFASAELLADGRLSVFGMQDEFGKKIFRYGADRLTQELEDFEVPEGSFVVFEQADDVLSLHDVGLASQQIKILAKWFKSRRMTGLLAFSRSNEQKLETLNTLLDHLTGIARLGGDRDGLEITFLYWRSMPGVIAARNFKLYTTETGLYAVSRRSVERVVEDEASSAAGDLHVQAIALSGERSIGSMPVPNRIATKPEPPMASEDAPTESAHVYLYVDRDLDLLRESVPGDWRPLRGVDEIFRLTLDIHRAMILLSTEAQTSIVELAKSVHALRKSFGLGTQILVREKNYAVTDREKQFLLNAGANVVVARDIAMGHYPKFLNSLRLQRFSRPFDPDFHSVLASLPGQGGGAQKPLEPKADATSIATPSYSYRDAGGAKSEPIAHRAIAKAKRSSLVS